MNIMISRSLNIILYTGPCLHGVRVGIQWFTDKDCKGFQLHHVDEFSKWQHRQNDETILIGAIKTSL